jgi:hypothetical protein
MKLTKGLRFYHARVLSTERFDGKTPQLYEVTRVTNSWVYFAPVYDRGTSGERLGKSDKCQPEHFSNLIHPTAEYLPLVGNWALKPAVDCQCGHSKELHDTQHPYECFAEIAQDQQCKCERFALPHYPQHQVFDSTDTVCQGCQTDGREPHTCPDAV